MLRALAIRRYGDASVCLVDGAPGRHLFYSMPNAIGRLMRNVSRPMALGVWLRYFDG